MKIVYIGTVNFSLLMLEKLIHCSANIVGVCTKAESSFNADFADLTPLCKAHDIPYQHVDDINSAESVKWIRDLQPDIIFCFGWSSLIKNELLQLPPMGIVGYHPTKLPLNRGRHPLIWALVLGLDESASTFFFMENGADDGDILSQETFQITDEDDASTLYSRIIEIASKQIENFLPQLSDDTYQRIRQDHQVANYWRKRSEKDGLIDFRMSSRAIYNLVRALTKPYIGAHLEYNKQKISIWKVKIGDTMRNNIEPGKVLAVNGTIISVKTYDGVIHLLQHEFLQLPVIGEYL